MSKIENYARTVNPSKISEFVTSTKDMLSEVESMLAVTHVKDQNMAIAKIFNKYGML